MKDKKVEESEYRVFELTAITWLRLVLDKIPPVENQDIYTWYASQYFGVLEVEVTPSMRQFMKESLHLINYGWEVPSDV